MRRRNKQLENRIDERTAALKEATEDANRRASQAELIYEVGNRVSSELELKTLLSEIARAIPTTTGLTAAGNVLGLAAKSQ